MKRSFGLILRILAILIGVNGVAGVGLSFMGDGIMAGIRGVFALLIACGIYYLGNRLSTQSK